MSGYTPPRKGPNVSQYIANLNAIPSPQDLAPQQDYVLNEELAIFTDTDFLDFNLEDLEHRPLDYDPARDDRLRRENATSKRQSHTVNDLAFDNGVYQFPEFPFVSTDSSNLPPSSAQTPFSPIRSSFDLASFSPTTAFAIDPQLKAGDKRPYTATSPTASVESSSRAAAEEDKRRRNTAASARFRVKKKQREQALEKTAKEMSDRANALEAKIQKLETENKWLRNLVVEKTSKGKEDVADLWRKFTRDSNANGRSLEVKEGVGTPSEDGSKG